jgi:5-enolpyruvylshikimate-3-phosphate synthase
MRMLSGILAGQPFTSELRGDESLSRRPMARIMKPLTEMGARISSQTKAGGLPSKFMGDRSKQFITGRKWRVRR